ncbi:MAG: hypothetical protein GW878_01375 [Acidobacteria bacterium]|nr:hypothetical protein [Acidobacteriota bacterium]
MPTSDPHVRALVGLDLVAAGRPGLTVLEARRTVVVISRSRRPDREIFLDRCAADDVPVIVRPSGGGAVVLSPGVVVANLVTDRSAGHSMPDDCFRCFGACAVASLGALGVTGITMRGVCDLCLGQRKVAGTALRLWRGLVLYQLSLLVDPDPGLPERYLPHPSREPDYRRGRGHGEFLTSLAEVGCNIAAGEIETALRKSFLPFVSGRFPQY